MLARRVLRTRRAGFTLIEVTIAVTVLSIAVLSTYMSQLSANDLLGSARETNVATTHLQAAMERMLTRPAAEIPTRFRPGEPLGGFDGALRGEAIVPLYPGFVEGTDVPDPLTIVLVTTWTDSKGRQRSLRLASMKTR